MRYNTCPNNYFFIRSTPEKVEQWPEPHSVHVSIIDAAIVIYGKLYVLVPSKHKMQMTEHFAECIKNTKNSVRQISVFWFVAYYILNVFFFQAIGRKRLEVKKLFDLRY